jgi:hypothetical protein
MAWLLFRGFPARVFRVIAGMFFCGPDDHHSRWRSRQAIAAFILVTWTAEPGNLAEHAGPAIHLHGRQIGRWNSGGGFPRQWK